MCLNARTWAYRVHCNTDTLECESCRASLDAITPGSMKRLSRVGLTCTLVAWCCGTDRPEVTDWLERPGILCIIDRDILGL